MDYIGIKTKSEESTIRFRKRTEKRRADLETVSQEDSFVGLAVERPSSEGRSSIQIAVRDGVLCAVDGRMLRGGNSQLGRRERRAGNSATAILGTWERRKLAGLKKMDLTASITLWDVDSNRLILARAQNGVPPIFYAETGDALLWGNSMKMLLRYGVEPELNRPAVDAYFGMGYTPSPWTLLKPVQKVPPGQLLDCTSEEMDVKRHRDPVAKTRNVGSLEDSAAELKRRLCRSLDQMVDGHDRVGVLLSSGVDSSLLVGLLHCELGVSVEAFTFDYTGYEGGFDERFNEYDRARRLTRKYDIPHHKIEYGPDWLNSNLSVAVSQYEEPFTYGIHTAPLKHVAERGIELLLNGVKGAGGFFISPASSYAIRLDGPLEKAVRKGSALLETWAYNTWPINKLLRKIRTAGKLKHVFDVIGSHASNIFLDHHQNSILSRELRRRLFSDATLPEAGRDAILALLQEEVRQTGLSRKVDRVSHLMYTFWVCDHLLWWNYRWTHANGVEMGAPFTTPTVQSWAQSLRQPLWPPYQESIMKIVTRQAASTVMPDEIAYYPKVAQTSPLLRWLKEGKLKKLRDKYLEGNVSKREIISNASVAEDVKEISNPWLVWNSICYMAWKKEFFHNDWTEEVDLRKVCP